MNKRLYKSNDNKMVEGVCGGIAEYFGIDPTLVKLITMALQGIWGFFACKYLIFR